MYVHEIHSDHIVEPLHVIQIVIQLKNVFFFFIVATHSQRHIYLKLSQTDYQHACSG